MQRLQPIEKAPELHYKKTYNINSETTVNQEVIK